MLVIVVVGRIGPSNLNDDFQDCPKFCKKEMVIQSILYQFLKEATQFRKFFFIKLNGLMIFRGGPPIFLL